MTLRRSLLAFAATAVSAPALADAPRHQLELDALAVYTQRNDARLPNDASATRFSLRDLTGAGPDASARLTYAYRLSPTQEIVALIAPLSLSGTGTLPQATTFQGRTFAAGVPIRADYRFDSYRLTWRYRLVEDLRWNLRVGVTAKVRNARIALAQGGTFSEKDDLGLVPLLHGYAEWRLAERVTLVADADAIAGGPGRAIDVGVRLRYALTPTWSLTAGWRMLDGGVDNEGQYNFARFHSIAAGVAAFF